MEFAEYALLTVTCIGGVIFTYINWVILKISRDIYNVSVALLEINIELFKVTSQIRDNSVEVTQSVGRIDMT